MLKAILFDVGGTLIENESWKDTVDQAIYNTMKNMGFKISDGRFREAFARSMDDYNQEKVRNPKLHSGINFTMERLEKYLGIKLTGIQKGQLKEEIEQHRLNNIKLLDNANEVLQDLAERYDIYIVSRGEGKTVRAMLKHLKIDHYFKEFFITEEMHADKESGKMFKLVLERTNLKPKEMIMIGNELRVDGACMQFGIPFCVVDRLNENPTDGYTFRIGDLGSIGNILKLLDENIEMKCKLCNANTVINEILCDQCKGKVKSNIISSPEKYALAKELSLYLNWEFNDAIESIMRGPILIRNEWLKKMPVTEKEIAEFYENSQNYIFDLAMAHLTNDWNKQDHELINYALVENYETVIDYGCGLANSALMLAEKGCKVTCVDVSDSLLNYVKWNASRKKIKVEISKSIDTKRKFDFVICTDVLEHIPKPVEILSRLADLVENGGAIALTTRFFREDDILHPMHLATNSDMGQEISAYLKGHGFVLDKNGSRGLEIWKKTK